MGEIGMDDKLYMQLDKLLGQIFMVEDDMRVLMHLLNELEMLFEYKGHQEARYFMKALLLIAKQIENDVDTADKSIDNITKVES